MTKYGILLMNREGAHEIVICATLDAAEKLRERIEDPRNSNGRETYGLLPVVSMPEAVHGGASDDA